MSITYEGVFGKSETKRISAAKLATSLKIYLGPLPMGPGIPPYPVGTLLDVGAKITVRIGIYSTREGTFISPDPQNVTVKHRVNGGAWENAWVGGWAANDTFDLEYTLDKAGDHDFYIEWPGNDRYEGCKKTLSLSAR